MLLLVLLLTVLTGGRRVWASPQFAELQESFAAHSQAVEPQLQQLRAENNDLRGERIRWALTELGNLTVEMRIITNRTWQAIESHEMLNDECWEAVKENFDYYVWYGSLDIGSAAGYMLYFLDDDWRQRFNPLMRSMEQVNTRAIYQTIQTLGRTRFVDNISDTVYELQDELNYQHYLWESYQTVLREHLIAIDQLALRMQDEMDWWHEFTLRWHQVFMDYAIDYVEYTCIEQK